MKQRTIALGELAGQVGGEVVGDPAFVVRAVAALDAAGPHDISFVTHPRYRSAAEDSKAGALIVSEAGGFGSRNLIVCNEPYLALARTLALLYPAAGPEPGISDRASVGRDVKLGRDVHVGPFAVVESGSELGDGACIGPGCVVGAGSRIGAGSRLHANVTLYPRTEIGERCLIHAGAVLGADGFGFATSGGRHHKIPQIGHVVVEDDVEIGANAAVDRGAVGPTRIGRGTKIDDLVMVAHGVRIGEHCLLVAQSGIAGSTRLGDGVTVAGQSGAAGHLEIGAGVVVAAKSAVFADVPDRSVVAGVPAVDHRTWKRAQALFGRLPEMRATVRELKRRVEELEAKLLEDG